MALSTEQKNEIVDRLIDNEGISVAGPWVEADREALDTLPQTKLVALNSQRILTVNAIMLAGNGHGGAGGTAAHGESKGKTGEKKTDAGYDDDDDDDDDAPKAKSKKVKVPAFLKNQNGGGDVTQNQPQTADQWLAAAPPEVRSVVNNAMAFEQRQKDELVTRITANENNQFTDEFLSDQSVEVLQGMASLATNEDDAQPAGVLIKNYAGVPGYVQNQGADFANEDADMVPEEMDWS